MTEADRSDRQLLARIIAWREAGWSFEKIGAHLKAEGFDPRDASWSNERILRQLVRQQRPEERRG